MLGVGSDVKSRLLTVSAVESLFLLRFLAFSFLDILILSNVLSNIGAWTIFTELKKRGIVPSKRKGDHIMRYIPMLLLVAVLYLSACVHSPSYLDQCQTWINRDATALIREWGPPFQTLGRPNGNTLYVWTKQRMDQSPVVAVPHPSTGTVYYTGGGATVKTCQTSFEATPQGIIVDVKVQGDGCP